MFRFLTESKYLPFRLLCAALSIFLCGCSVGINVDTMLTPPKLSAEQEQIYQALKDTTGSGIRLKYPRSGSYLSSFIITDIDGDSLNEAIAFYEYSGAASYEGSLRINVLDCIDGKWLSVCDRSAEGSEIEKVLISQLGDNDRTNIIVGYSGANKAEKSLSIYNYEENYLQLTFTQNYSLFDVTPTARDGSPDLVLVAPSTSNSDAYAAVYRLSEDGQYHEYKHRFSESYTEFAQMIYGTAPSGNPAVYIDAAGVSGFQTEVLSMNESRFVSLLDACHKTASDTVRKSGLFSMDIDGDGVPEIPVQSVFQGYEDAAETEQIFQTKWLTLSNKHLYVEHVGYYSAANGYVFLFPKTWEKDVTMIYNNAENELHVCLYDGKLREDAPVLLRIYIAYDQADLDEHLSAGYTLFRTKGTASYLMKSEPESVLPVPAGDVLLAFRFIG